MLCTWACPHVKNKRGFCGRTPAQRSHSRGPFTPEPLRRAHLSSRRFHTSAAAAPRVALTSLFCFRVLRWGPAELSPAIARCFLEAPLTGRQAGGEWLRALEGSGLGRQREAAGSALLLRGQRGADQRPPGGRSAPRGHAERRQERWALPGGGATPPAIRAFRDSELQQLQKTALLRDGGGWVRVWCVCVCARTHM